MQNRKKPQLYNNLQNKLHIFNYDILKWIHMSSSIKFVIRARLKQKMHKLELLGALIIIHD